MSASYGSPSTLEDLCEVLGCFLRVVIIGIALGVAAGIGVIVYRLITSAF